MISFATDTGIQAEMIRLFGFGPKFAALIVLILSMFGSLLAGRLWSLIVWFYESSRFGGWQIRVRGGRSGREWHMPLEAEIVKALLTGRYIAFKQALGAIVSGEGTVNFQLGFDVTQPLTAAPPTAPGLAIDCAGKMIVMDFGASMAAPIAPKEG